MFDSPLGKVVGVILAIIFFPFIAYAQIREFFGVRKTKKDLRNLALVNKNFEWFNLKNRVTEVFGRVHSAWRKEDMGQASEWMTHWYWQNQQIVYLDKWEEQGLVNNCDVRKVIKMKPLHVVCSNQENFEESRIVMSIEANMEDYLAERESGRVVEGKKGYKDVETIWTFILEDGKWKAENIEEGRLSLSYAKLKNSVPKVVLSDRVVA